MIRPRRARASRLRLVVVATAAALLPTRAASAPARILLLVSSDTELVQRTADAAARAAESSGVAVERIELGGDEAKGRAALARSDADPPSAVISVGFEAAKACFKARTRLPVIFALLPTAPSGAMLKLLPAARGVRGHLGAKVLLDRVRLHLPDVRRIGVPHEPSRAGDRVAEAAAMAKDRGLKIVPMAVASPKEVPDAYRAARAGIEALWLLPDAGPSVFNSGAIEFLRDQALLDRLALIAQDAALRGEGALLTVEQSPASLGAQLVEMALEGGAATAPRMVEAVAFEVHVLKSLADRLGIPVRGGHGAVIHR